MNLRGIMIEWLFHGIYATISNKNLFKWLRKSEGSVMDNIKGQTSEHIWIEMVRFGIKLKFHVIFVALNVCMNWGGDAYGAEASAECEAEIRVHICQPNNTRLTCVFWKMN